MSEIFNLEDYKDELEDILGESRRLGFLGPIALESHISQAQGFAEVIMEHLGYDEGLLSGEKLLDLGSGGGLPGLVLVAELTSITITLLEASSKRSEFLKSVISGHGLDTKVNVYAHRAELAGRDPAMRSGYGIVVARSFGPPGVVAECAAPLLREGGWLIVSEPPQAQESEFLINGSESTLSEGNKDQPLAVRWPNEYLAELGLSFHKLVVAGYRFAVMQQMSLCPEKFPRRVGVPNKRPLF